MEEMIDFGPDLEEMMAGVPGPFVEELRELGFVIHEEWQDECHYLRNRKNQKRAYVFLKKGNCCSSDITCRQMIILRFERS